MKHIEQRSGEVFS